MNLYSQILKDKLTPEQYKKIPLFLRHRDEPDLFYHPIYNLFIESINSRKKTTEEIQEACRIASGKKVPELLKAGDRIKIHAVMGTFDQPYFCNGNNRSWVIKNIHGPYYKSMEYETPEHYCITGTDGSVLNDMIAINGVVCKMWKADIEFIEVVNTKDKR